jgi:hypothetical protein
MTRHIHEARVARRKQKPVEVYLPRDVVPHNLNLQDAGKEIPRAGVRHGGSRLGLRCAATRLNASVTERIAPRLQGGAASQGGLSVPPL